VLRASALITIAEVQGDAFGFGFGLAILCDFTLVSSSAKLAFPEMRKGLPPAAIMAYLGRYALPKQVFWPYHERLRLPHTARAPLTDHPREMSAPV
jgi:methylglutaconyl-CoA hydratase